MWTPSLRVHVCNCVVRFTAGVHFPRRLHSALPSATVRLLNLVAASKQLRNKNGFLKRTLNRKMPRLKLEESQRYSDILFVL